MNRLLQEQWHLDELPEGVSTAWTPEEGWQIRQELDASDQEILASYPVSTMAASIREKVQRQDRVAFRRTTFLPLMAAAAFVLSFTLGPLLVPADSERIKGSSSQLEVFRQTQQGAVRLADGDRARAGDRLQVEFQTVPHTWVLVFSVDGKGVLTPHFPDAGTAAVQVANAKTVVPAAYVLDAAPSYERFYLVVGDHRFSRDEVWGVLKQHSDLPSGLKFQTLTLTKEP